METKKMKTLFLSFVWFVAPVTRKTYWIGFLVMSIFTALIGMILGVLYGTETISLDMFMYGLISWYIVLAWIGFVLLCNRLADIGISRLWYFPIVVPFMLLQNEWSLLVLIPTMIIALTPTNYIGQVNKLVI